MSEAVVNFEDAINLLIPAFNNKIVQVVWDEHKATVTVVKEEENQVQSSNNLTDDERKQRAKYLRELNEALALSRDEELIYIPRKKQMREPIDLSD